LSGGVSLRSLQPAAAFCLWRRFEAMLEPWMNSLAMFCTIVLSRRGKAAEG